MQEVGKFEKVSRKQFCDALMEAIGPKNTEQYGEDIYGRIALPARATVGSAGYDFRIPYDVTLQPGESVKIPTGVRVNMLDGWFLACFPRSGLGFKYRLQLNNTIGVIDSDYYRSDNEGHIFAKLTNDSREGKTLRLKMGDAFMQGIFLPFGLAEGDHTTAERNGGMGSTGN